MSKKKLTNKEITKAIDGLSDNDHYLHNKLLQLDNLLGLYLEFSNDTEKFNNFVKAKAEEFERKQLSKDKDKK